MEHHAQSADDALIGGLSYKLKPSASYVTNRRTLSYFASGGNTYSPNGVKVMKFDFAGDQWLNPSTFRVAFQLNYHNGNNGAGFQIMVQPLCWNPAVFFRRCRLIAGGQIIEDIDDFNRLSVMMTALKPVDEQSEIAMEGFGLFADVNGSLPINQTGWNEPGAGEADDQRKAYRVSDWDEYGPVRYSKTVLSKPMLGILAQEKLIPLRFCPITIELELVSDAAD